MADGKPKNKSHWDPGSPQQVAQNRVRQEVKAGRIVKPDACEVCGADLPLSGHHWRGYRHPLDVWWVCVSCNTRLPDHDGSVTLDQARRRMKKQKKTDNHNPRAKLDLRRYFLRKYHPEPPDVLDCCQGGGVLWKELRGEFETRTYWGVDLKPKKGRLKLDSSRILQQPGWPQNVIDIDAYGSPWRHWMLMLPNITRPVTVFLTIGKTMFKNASREEIQALSLPAKTPPFIAAKISEKLGVSYCLARACKYAVIEEAVEAESTGSARYIGVRLKTLTSK